MNRFLVEVSFHREDHTKWFLVEGADMYKDLAKVLVADWLHIRAPLTEWCFTASICVTDVPAAQYCERAVLLTG